MAIIPDPVFDLLIKEFTEGLDSGEALQVHEWLGVSAENRAAYRNLQELWLNGNLAGLKAAKTSGTAWATISGRSNVRKKRRFVWLSASVAATVALLVGAYLLTGQFNSGQEQLWAALSEHADQTEAVHLVLPSGTELALDDSLNGSLDVDGELVYKDLSGISYSNSPDAKKPEKAVIHELVVPRGGHYVLTLADGTIVTLNSESTIKFPTHFSDSLREVWLEGEAYFDVERNPAKPFIVYAGNMSTRVLGTQFNVRAYNGEEQQSVTLVEGAVALKTEDDKVLLKPGERFWMEPGTNNISSGVEQVDPYLYTSWKEGIMYFDDITLEDLMVRLNRWYNFEYEFKDGTLKRRLFTGGVKKNDDLKKIFSLIGMVNDVSFTIEGERIIIDKK